VATEPVRAISDAAANILGGGADSVASSFQAFQRELEPDNVSRIGLTNAFITGMLEGYASFFEGMASVSRRLLDEVRNPPQASPGETIDYERLARMVANELRRQQREDQKV
jgi:hypothetical protein